MKLNRTYYNIDRCSRSPSSEGQARSAIFALNTLVADAGVTFKSSQLLYVLLKLKLLAVLLMSCVDNYQVGKKVEVAIQNEGLWKYRSHPFFCVCKKFLNSCDSTGFHKGTKP